MQKDKIKSPFYYFFYPFVYIMAGLILLFHSCLTALELTKTYGLMYGSLYSLLILAAIAAYSLLLYATGRLISSKLKKNPAIKKMAAYAVQWGISFIIQSYYFDFSVFAQSNELAVIKVGSFLWVFLSIYIFLNFWLLTISAIRYYIFSDK